MRFVMAGGGTGGHVIPSIAVALELKQKGHDVFFIGTRDGYEGKLVPKSGFPIEWIEIGGLMRVGLRQARQTLFQLPSSVLRCYGLLKGVSAVFSMGGYVAAPVMLAAWLRRIPIVIMEPNAMPGITNRRMGKIAKRILVSFEEAAKYFPQDRVEVTGLPVRPEFFAVPDREPGAELHLLVTGGSQGAKRLNDALPEAYPSLENVRVVHQTGSRDSGSVASKFASSKLDGEVVTFIDDMPKAFAEADLVVCRSGAGTVAELAAAGKPSILVPFPFAADDHQFHNAKALRDAGAAILVRDSEMNGARLLKELERLDATELKRMSAAARRFAKRGAAERAAELLIALGR
jgi:UDP-N-acetylglucosamine--N-acetylmuramyl-(pentapeptide) pyrophosphoryl-undecaprenol N-acetylglucosamine transferase